MMRRQKVVFRIIRGSLHLRLYQRVLLIKSLRVDLFGMNGRKDTEPVVGQSHIIPITGAPRRYDTAAADLSYEIGEKRCDHLLFFSHPSEPNIRFDSHINERKLLPPSVAQ